jgi:hypothetical protein
MRKKGSKAPRRSAPRARGGVKATPESSPGRALNYKVVELSNVDEAALERTLNDWVPRGWAFDGVQFAMRESSKRPAMAFVFFTREGDPLPDHDEPTRVVAVPSQRAFNPVSTSDAWARLRELAGEDGPDS